MFLAALRPEMAECVRGAGGSGSLFGCCAAGVRWVCGAGGSQSLFLAALRPELAGWACGVGDPFLANGFVARVGRGVVFAGEEERGKRERGEREREGGEGEEKGGKEGGGEEGKEEKGRKRGEGREEEDKLSQLKCILT